MARPWELLRILSTKHAAQLNPADLIVAYTDGVVEAGNTEGEEWGVLASLPP